MAGIRTVEELLAIVPDKYAITVFGSEPYGNYNRIMLSSVLSGEKSIEDIVTHDRRWYSDLDIVLHAGPEKAVIAIDRAAQTVTAADGTRAEYDRLLIATGSRPVVPSIPGIKLDGVISFRDIFDVNTMIEYSRKHRHAVVMGGGLLGLEAANGLLSRGMRVSVAHRKPVLLNRQMDAQAGKLLQQQLQERGLEFKVPGKVRALLGDARKHVRSVVFDDGSEKQCDLFITAIGIRPNLGLAKKAGLHCQRGIVVNDYLQTSDANIHAVGECIQHRGKTFGLVAPLFEQARVCADYLSDSRTEDYRTLPTATKLKVTGIDLFSVGNFSAEGQCESIVFSDPLLGIYKKLVIQENNLIGAVLYGDTADGSWYHELLTTEQDISEMREFLIFGQRYLTTAGAAS